MRTACAGASVDCEESARLTSLLRRRLAAGQARVSQSLRAVRVSLALPPESAPWPNGAPVERLRALHRLLDEDETLLVLFTEAVRADRCDPLLPGPYPAELA